MAISNVSHIVNMQATEWCNAEIRAVLRQVEKLGTHEEQLIS